MNEVFIGNNDGIDRQIQNGEDSIATDADKEEIGLFNNLFTLVNAKKGKFILERDIKAQLNNKSLLNTQLDVCNLHTNT